MAEIAPLQIEALSKAHDRTGFDCGQADLNTFLQKYALQHHKTSTSRTHIALDQCGKIIGFYTLSTASLCPQTLPEQYRLPRYPVPCVRIGRFAVHVSMQGQGLGKILLVHALRQIKQVSLVVGVSFVLVDAKDEKASQFYEKLGFSPITNQPLTLFLHVNMIP